MTSRMVRQNGYGVRGRLLIPERADAGHAAYRAARPASGPRRDGARRPRRRAPAACPAHSARPAGRACRAGGLAGRPDLAGRIAGQPRQRLADAGLAAANRTTPGQPGPGDRVAPGRIPARGTAGGVDALDFQVLAVRGSHEPILGHSAVRTRTTGCHQSRVVCAKCPQVAASAESILRPGRARQHRWVGRSR